MSSSITLSTRSIEASVSVVNGFFGDVCVCDDAHRTIATNDCIAATKFTVLGSEAQGGQSASVPTIVRQPRHGGHGAVRLCPPYGSRRGGRVLYGLAFDVAFRDGAVAPEAFGFIEAAVAALDHRLGGFGEPELRDAD